MKSKTSTLLRYGIIVLGLLSATLCTSYFAAFWIANNKRPLMAYMEVPYITAATGERITSIKAGQSIVLNQHIRRQPYHCWAEYATTMMGPVNYSFPIRRSSIIYPHVTESYLKTFLQTPADLPPGTYKFQQVMYPTCSGIPLDPFIAGFAEMSLDVVP